jgi:hypothetical protein
MKHILKVILIIALTLSLAPLSLAVTKAKKRYCTVNMVGGELVKGYFIGANSRQLIVEVEGVRKTINLDRIANILFTVDFKNRRMNDVEP